LSLLAAVVFVVTIGLLAVRQVTGRGPRLWVLLLGGGAASVALGILSVPAAATVLGGDLPVLALLFALFLFVAALDRSGALDHLARWILSRARGPEDLPFLLFLGFGVLSGFILNDALVLLGVPLVFAVARRVAADPSPLLFSLAYAVTVGSVLTPLGNPQNLLVALGSGMSAPIAVFLRYLLVPTALNLVAGGAYLRWSFRNAARPPGRSTAAAFPRIPLFPRDGWGRRLRRAPVLLLLPATLGLMVAFDLVTDLRGWSTPPIDLVALAGAALLLVASPGRVENLRRVDWSVLLLFVGLFLLVGGAQAGGVLAGVEHVLPIPGPGTPAPIALGSILGASLLGPQVVSNVPWVALEIPVLHGLGYGGGASVDWVALAAGSTLAGNLTLLGAASNLIVVEEAAKRAVTLRLAGFLRHGLPLVAITTGILFVCLWAGL
jgi:Na+/H+ antiporter NhaD/arsenite permease-like protein